MTEQLANNVAGNLNFAYTNTDTAMTLQSGQGAAFPASGNFRILIGSELILVGARTGDTLSSLTRGIESTTAASHSIGDVVTQVLTQGGLLQYIRENGLVPVPTTNVQSGSAYTAALTDQDNIIEMSSASANTLTIPLNATVAFVVGHSITVIQTGAGQTTIAIAGGGTLNSTPGLKIAAQWGTVTLLKRATDTWLAVGNLTP